MKPNEMTADEARKILRDAPQACVSEADAVEFLERMRWPDGAACPRCGDCDVYQMQSRSGGREKHYRWRCRGCKKQFTVRSLTVMDDTNIRLRHWCLGIWLQVCSKKGISSLQFSRMTGVSYKSSLFLTHRIRHAMAGDPSGVFTKLKGEIEADEAFVGGRPRRKNERARFTSKWRKTPIVGVIQRGGALRAQVVTSVTGKTLRKFIHKHTDPSASTLCTDEYRTYRPIGREFAGGHIAVRHEAYQFVKYPTGNATVVGHTNSLEGFWAHLKKKINATHHAVSARHLPKYLDEAVFHWNTRKLGDGARLMLTVQRMFGKRLYYRAPAVA